MFGKFFVQSIKISEANIGIGNSSITISCDKTIQEIAYKIWVELITRKIGIEFDEENDVITEVYDSWYQAFGVIRSLLEEIPGDDISNATGLIEITIKVLNEGLRPHLTKWQAKYRLWYKQKNGENNDLTPQQLQRQYPQYDEMVEDLKSANKIIIQFSRELYKVFDSK